jgi:hypothetical protein
MQAIADCKRAVNGYTASDDAAPLRQLQAILRNAEDKITVNGETDAVCSKGARGRNTSRRGEPISSKGDDDATASATTSPIDHLHHYARRSRRVS